MTNLGSKSLVDIIDGSGKRQGKYPQFVAKWVSATDSLLFFLAIVLLEDS
jgi:hypothetical protein